MDAGPRELASTPAREREAGLLFLVCLAVIACLFGSRLAHYPAAFLADEAVHTIEFERLAANKWRSVHPPHELLPAYFRNVTKYNLSTSVYVHGLAAHWFGRSIETVRGISVACCLSAVVALALLLRRAGLREWWLVVPLSGCLPAWLLHARTGYEVALTAGSFGWFLYFYYRYRSGEPWCILPAIAAGAGTFYSYAGGQGLMLAAGLGLAVCDWRWHRRHPAWAMGGLAVALVLILPFLRFRWHHPDMLAEHFGDIRTYVSDPRLGPLGKLREFTQLYLSGMSPGFWFQPSSLYPRHDAVGLPNASLVLAPLVAVGLVAAWRQRAAPAVRLLVLAWCAGPVSAALAGLGVNRVLPMFLPLLAVAALGASSLAGPLRRVGWRRAARWGAAGLLLLQAAFIQQQCLAEGGTYTRLYGLHGLQWGAPQIFRGVLPELAREEPAGRLIVSHSWANHPAVFVPFLGGDRLAGRRVEFLDYRSLSRDDSAEPGAHDILLLPAREYLEMRRDPAVAEVRDRAWIRAPDGRRQFWAGSVIFRPDKRELRRREQLVASTPILGTTATVSLAGVDEGSPTQLLRGDAGVVRCHPGVPLECTIELAQARPIEEVVFHHWDAGALAVTGTAYLGGEVIARYEKTTEMGPESPRREAWTLRAAAVTRLEIRAVGPAGEIVHLRRLELRAPGTE